MADTRRAALFIRAYVNQSAAPAGATIWVDDVFVGPTTQKTPTRTLHSRVQVQAGQPFTFRSPSGGALDYIVVYLWERTDKTQNSLWSPMDVYRGAPQKVKP